jgi:hypothetical protein
LFCHESNGDLLENEHMPLDVEQAEQSIKYENEATVELGKLEWKEHGDLWAKHRRRK